MPKNLIEALLEQMNRCRELQKHYDQLGRAGIFAKLAIEHYIKLAEAAMAGGDAIEMIAAYKELESWQ